MLYRDPKVSLSHDTTDYIATHPQQPGPRACAPLALRASRSCRRASWPCRGRLVTRYWPYRGPCCAPVSLAYHDTIHCIVTQSWKMGSSSAFQQKFFFFHLFQLLQDPKKNYIYIYIYFMSSVEQNKFMKIYFILFYFFQFYTL